MSEQWTDDQLREAVKAHELPAIASISIVDCLQLMRRMRDDMLAEHVKLKAERNTLAAQLAELQRRTTIGEYTNEALQNTIAILRQHADAFGMLPVEKVNHLLEAITRGMQAKLANHEAELDNVLDTSTKTINALNVKLAQLLKDYEALLAYTRRLHTAVVAQPEMAGVCQDAPYDVLREEKL